MHDMYLYVVCCCMPPIIPCRLCFACFVLTQAPKEKREVQVEDKQYLNLGSNQRESILYAEVSKESFPLNWIMPNDAIRKFGNSILSIATWRLAQFVLYFGNPKKPKHGIMLACIKWFSFLTYFYCCGCKLKDRTLEFTGSAQSGTVQQQVKRNHRKVWLICHY